MNRQRNYQGFFILKSNHNVDTKCKETIIFENSITDQIKAHQDNSSRANDMNSPQGQMIGVIIQLVSSSLGQITSFKKTE